MAGIVAAFEFDFHSVLFCFALLSVALFRFHYITDKVAIGNICYRRSVKPNYWIGKRSMCGIIMVCIQYKHGGHEIVIWIKFGAKHNSTESGSQQYQTKQNKTQITAKLIKVYHIHIYHNSHSYPIFPKICSCSCSCSYSYRQKLVKRYRCLGHTQLLLLLMRYFDFSALVLLSS